MPAIALTTINYANRSFKLQVPANFNNKVCFFLHGATGSSNDLLTSPFLSLMLTNGYGVIMPDADPLYSVTGNGSAFYRRWASDVIKSDDVNFFNYIITNLKALCQTTAQVDYFVVGGSSGALMATRISLFRRDCRGIVMVNGSSAQASYFSGVSTFAFNDDLIEVQPGHCPVLHIASTVDALIPLSTKQAYQAALQAKGIDATLTVDPAGDHNWSAWTASYHPQMMTWLNAH